MDDTELCELLNHHLVNDKIKKYYDYNGTVVTNKFKDIAEDIANLEVKDSDIYVTSFPKSGMHIFFLLILRSFVLVTLTYFFILQEQHGLKKWYGY